MILLAMDTSTDHAVLALMDRAGQVRVETTEAGRRHGRDLIPRLKSLLASSAIEPGELQSIAVGLGPGSYTGSRVGVTAAKTLAYATGAALIGLNSLHVIGRNAPLGAPRVWAVADAQRGELYVAELIRQAPGASLTPASETRIENLPAWAARLESGDIVVGPAVDAPRVRSVIPSACLPPAGGENFPRGESLIELAREAIAAGRHENPWLLEPFYLRRSAAKGPVGSPAVRCPPAERAGFLLAARE